MNSVLDNLEQTYIAKFGHTYTMLKARSVPNYIHMLAFAISSGIVLTDKTLGLNFPPGAAQ